MVQCIASATGLGGGLGLRVALSKQKDQETKSYLKLNPYRLRSSEKVKPVSLRVMGPERDREIKLLVVETQKPAKLELELELVQSHMTQKPVRRGEVGACRFTQLTSTANEVPS